MLGLGSELVLGALPRSAVGYRAYFEIEKRAHELMLGGRLSLAFAHAQLPDTAKLNIFVQTWTARLEACGARELVRTVWLQACLGPTLGVYHSYSTQVVNADDQLRPWFTLNAGGRVRWFPAGPGFFTELYGTAAYAATSYDTVARDGSGAGHLVPRLLGEVGIGLGHSFDFP